MNNPETARSFLKALRLLLAVRGVSAPEGWYASNYMYDPNTPHAVTAVNRISFTDSFDYDANGNMTCRVEKGTVYKQTYNAENRISSIAKINGDDCDDTEPVETWAFLYDGDGVRVSTAHYSGLNTQPDSVTRYYFGGAYETTGTLTTENTWKKYYFFAGQTSAMRDEMGIKYFLTDHLGSIVAVTEADEYGTLITTQQRYLPFGQVRTDVGMISFTDFGYTGQRELDEGMGGIMDYKARFYSPYINRFLSADTIVPDYANPQSLNRYSYVINNPLRYTDPTGHMMATGDGGGKPKKSCPSCVQVVKEKIKKHKETDKPIKSSTYSLADLLAQNSGGGGGGTSIDIFETIVHDDLQALEDNDCFTQGPETMDWTNSKCVDAVSFLTQDIATLSSSVSASWTATATVLGCAAEGVGCVAGYGVGFVDHLMYFNPLESTASFISFGLTSYSDLLTHDTYFDSWTDWGVGEDTKTGLVTFVAGSLTVEPFFDAGIDIYASGYNHGYFCGISTVAACAESMMRGFP